MGIDRVGTQSSSAKVARAYGRDAVARPESTNPHGATPAPAAPVDQVSLSPEARAVAAARKAVDAAPDVREEKVADVTRRIQDGTYQVSPKKIAEQLARQLREGGLS